MGSYRGYGEKQKVYEESERHAALELAATVGIAPAARHLGIDRKTIHRWIERYPRLWSDLRAGDPAASKRRIAQNLEDLADRYAAAEHDLLERVEDELIAKTDAKEAAALLKAMGSSRQAAIAGARTVAGEPEQREVNINFPALEAAMERLLNGAAAAPALPPVPVPNEAEHAHPGE